MTTKIIPPGAGRPFFFVWLISVLMLTFTIAQAQAFTPTAEQIAYFKSLPKAEQEALARQYGVNLNQLSAPANVQATVAEPLPSAGVRKASQTYNATTETDIPHQFEGIIPEPTAKTLKRFGYDLFQGNASAFQPNINIPVPADYIVGPGDTFVVQLYGKENASYSLEVTREGLVHFPELGPISLAGLKFSQAQEVINRAVAEQMIGVKSAVTMGTLRTIRVFVLGEAVQPGSYVVGSLSTMTNALFASGGVTQIGSLRNIQLKRQGEVVANLDLYNLLLDGDTRQDVRLQPGDVIFIPPVGATIGIDGEVRRPAIYEVRHEKNTADALRLAGGLLPTAFPKASRVERINERGDRTVLDVDLSTPAGKGLALKPADVIRVYSVLDIQEDIIQVQGHVKRPGITAWKPGIRISQVLGGIRELMPNPDLKAGLVVREVPPARKLQAVMFNPEEALTRPGSSADLILQPRDRLYIFNLESDRSKQLESLVQNLRTQADRSERQKVVSVVGNVRFPGDYPLAENMSAQQLIQLAGGMRQNAYDQEAEITRYTLDEQQRRQISYLNVPLAAASQQYLQSEDRLTIRQLPEWTPQESIELTGEVKFPGKYTLRRGETLSQVIQRAGGLTDQAYPQGAIFTRKELQELERQRLQELRQQLESDIAAANVEQQDDKEKTDLQDARQLLSSMDKIKPLGRMVIDLDAVLTRESGQDVRILNGDSLYIPHFKQAVSVVGEVQYPTSHFYQRKLGVQDYIDRSGGTNMKADKSRVYVVKANGRVFLPQKSRWFSRDVVEIEPGDTVVVPLDVDRIKTLTLWTSVSQVFYQIALGAAAVASF